ncbi:SulP family inorganic anion transporter [Neopusillimonas maritima]|jgi:MFS superfamily sulfate permease-like transporter|uniref:STAS domain-containing protein n=1 Tax=Neopusillimonas maritima TaxID=2026239 RepID=A0ABX9MV79_9BURK|nr:SulP family inorganic anion transporter [Neopusillimonas maritima]RII82732.1 hypothetical protein CJO09_09060 [Neopusillimonas maritima]
MDADNDTDTVEHPNAPKTWWTKTVAWIPGLGVVRQYPIHWLKDDIIAGIVLVTILVPVGIAYSVAAGLPPVYGLYATIIPLFAYALFGPSRIMVLGPDSALAAVIFAVVVPLSGGSPEKAVALAGVMAVAAGFTCLLAGLARLGFITDLLSKPIRYGYMNGIALVVIVSQLPVLFGFTVDGGGTPTRAWEFLQALLNGQTQFWSLLIGVAVLGLLPQGFPSFAFPVIPVSDVLQVAVGGVVAALLAVSETSVLSRAYATKTGDKVSANREMVGLGMANLATGFFQGFPISSSASRTPVAQAAGARSQLANVVGALLVLVLLVYAPELLHYLPDTVLAAVVIASMIGLMEIRSVGRIYRMRPAEFWLSLGCSAGIVVLGPIQGIGLAVLVALISFLWESWRPYSAVLVRVDNLKGYHDVSRYPHGRRIPGLVLFRWDAPLFFANAELFQERALAAVSSYLRTHNIPWVDWEQAQ